MKYSPCDRKLSPIAKAAVGAALCVGAAAAVNALIFYLTPPLTSKLESGDIRYYPTATGDIFYQKAGTGPPLLLVHGIGAGESSFEFRKVWRELSATNTVYALDLVGFGKSDKPRIDYDAETYIQLISAFVRDVVTLGEGPYAKTSVIASSLSAAFVVTAADRDPSLFDRLILICPTGIEELAKPVTVTGAAVRAALRTPILGTSLYNLIAGKPFIRSYLKRMIYAAPASVTEAVVTHYHVSSHQIGGERVLPSFVAGYLNVSIKEALGRLSHPPLIIWGRSARQSPVERSEAFLQADPRARRVTIEDAGMLPHEERPEAFLAAVANFLHKSTEGAASIG